MQSTHCVRPNINLYLARIAIIMLYLKSQMRIYKHVDVQSLRIALTSYSLRVCMKAKARARRINSIPDYTDLIYLLL